MINKVEIQRMMELVAYNVVKEDELQAAAWTYERAWTKEMKEGKVFGAEWVRWRVFCGEFWETAKWPDNVRLHCFFLLKLEWQNFDLNPSSHQQNLHL